MKLLIIFIVLNIVNVIIQTFKSLAIVKCGKTVASVVNAVAFGIYTVVLVYMNCDLLLWQKVIVVALTNLVGVYIVKLIEEKMRKDKLWRIECTIPPKQLKQLLNDCKYYHLSYNYIDIGKYVIINFYCPTQQDSLNVKKLMKSYDCKYFVTESKVL